MWEDLKSCTAPLLIIAGEKDGKFKKIAQEMLHELGSSTMSKVNGKSEKCQMVVVPDSGHAVHLENPLACIRALRQFLEIIRNSRTN